jgi:hypothetical protein
MEVERFKHRQLRYTLFSTAAVFTGGDSWLDLLGMAANALGEKP